ncbi:MAG: hypothetical protein PF480_04665 [Roseovarius sp.]|jgi:hypothetical protein|nr:hypothetical protein [Roseovarius sp.]
MLTLVLFGLSGLVHGRAMSFAMDWTRRASASHTGNLLIALLPFKQ